MAHAVDSRARVRWDLWQPGLAIVDFTNPAACAWYTSKLEVLIDMVAPYQVALKVGSSAGSWGDGTDADRHAQTDFGERIPHIGVKYHDGSDPR